DADCGASGRAYRRAGNDLAGGPDLEQVVHCVLEAPLALAGLNSTAPEATHAPLAKLAEGCLDGPSPLAVDGLAPLGRQLAGHALGLGEPLRDAAPGSVSVLSGGDQQ